MSKIPTPAIKMNKNVGVVFLWAFDKGGVMTKAQCLQKLKKKDKAVLDKVFAKIRKGCSLYGAVSAVGLTSREFYQMMSLQPNVKEEFLLALADYADQCTDDIRAMAASLKSGEIDNSTAKLLIETTKWLAQKACPEPVAPFEEETAETLSEIVVKFVS